MKRQIDLSRGLWKELEDLTDGYNAGVSDELQDTISNTIEGLLYLQLHPQAEMIKKNEEEEREMGNL